MVAKHCCQGVEHRSFLMAYLQMMTVQTPIAGTIDADQHLSHHIESCWLEENTNRCSVLWLGEW